GPVGRLVLDGNVGQSRAGALIVDVDGRSRVPWDTEGGGAGNVDATVLHDDSFGVSGKGHSGNESRIADGPWVVRQNVWRHGEGENSRATKHGKRMHTLLHHFFPPSFLVGRDSAWTAESPVHAFLGAIAC